MTSDPKKLILVTPTYPRKHRQAFLERCIRLFSPLRNIQWIVVEDGSACAPDVERKLRQSGLNFIYLHHGPTRDYATSQRNYAFTYIRDNRLEGIVYAADDDNYYHLKLFEEIRKTKSVSVFPVGHLGPSGIERPVVKNGRIIDWDCGWKSRRYPLDWAGFAFNAALLKDLPDPILKGVNYFEALDQGLAKPDWPDEQRVAWLRSIKDGESEFLEKLLSSKDDFEILCNDCRDCYVWHNQPLHEKPFLTCWKARGKHFLSQLLRRMGRRQLFERLHGQGS